MNKIPAVITIEQKAEEYRNALLASLTKGEQPRVVKMFIVEHKEFNDTERTITAYCTTVDRDRYGDTVQPDGMNNKNYRRNPVILWAHNYTVPPIAKSLWEKPDAKGVRMKMQFDTRDEAMEVYRLYKEGYLNAFSIGFLPMEYEQIFEGKSFTGFNFKTWELIENSAVPVPANPEALQDAYTRGILHTDVLVRSFSDSDSGFHEFIEMTKGVIPYKKHPLAPEGEAWDGPGEIAKAEVADLKVMCTWYDSEKPDVKGSYKLPHHKCNSDYTTVWNGVKAAMGVVLGALGGVNIPEEKLKSCYNHLAKHYAEFEKEVPEFKLYTDEELRGMFPEIIEDKSGAVLSGKNKEILLRAHHHCEKCLHHVKDVLDSVDDGDGKSIHTSLAVMTNQADGGNDELLQAISAKLDQQQVLLEQILEAVGEPNDGGATTSGKTKKEISTTSQKQTVETAVPLNPADYKSLIQSNADGVVSRLKGRV
jgi:HK97 family phage prohead protease